MEKVSTLSIKSIENYLKRSALRENLISKPPTDELLLIVVIPVYKEDNLLNCLDSLAQCDPLQSEKQIEVILIFNSAAADKEGSLANEISAQEVLEWSSKERKLPFELHLIEENQLADKKAGVGLARKLGMDEAVRRALELRKANLPIFCLDADCSVAANYFIEISDYFITHPEKEAVSIAFEHPLSGDDHAPEIYQSILWYELHLRYYKRAMTYIGLPFDFYTVGSSMGVRADAYAKEGGMNQRKAGEDFYFLQKYILNQTLGELNTTKVYPSPRISKRVPFGTGKAILDQQEGKRDLQLSYSMESVQLLKDWLGSVKAAYPHLPLIPKELSGFIDQENFNQKWEEICLQTSDWKSFQKRFYQWLSPFKLLKIFHYLRDYHFPDMPLKTSANKLNAAVDLSERELLERYRELDGLH